MRLKLTKSQKKRLAKAIVGLIILLIGYVVNKISEPTPHITDTLAPGYYRVLKIEDGDTITVDMAGTAERIRMIGVDTPETQDPRKPVQCFGKAATHFTTELINTQPVRLEADSLSDNRDRYNRLLRYVYIPDGRLVQAEIIKSGYGFAYTNFPFTKSEEFRTYQQQARAENRGLWKSCEPTTNQYGGYTSNPE